MKQYEADRAIWSPRHNGVDKQHRRAIVIHTDESAWDYGTGRPRAGGWTAERLAEYNAEPTDPLALRGSYQLGVDAKESVRQINTRGVPWSTGNIGNNQGIHVCIAGSTAHWTREQWLNRLPLLKHVAYVARREADINGIPIRKIDDRQLLAGSWGVTGHHDWSKAYGGSTNWDPGGYPDTAGGFPWDVFIDLMGEAVALEAPAGAAESATTGGENTMADLNMELEATDGTKHKARELIVYTDGRVYEMYSDMIPRLEDKLDALAEKIDRLTGDN